MDEITKKLLDYIEAYNKENGVGPSLDDMAAHVGLSKAGVANRINAMVGGGLLKRGTQHRSLQVVKP